MLIVFHCRRAFIKDADGKPYILIVFTSISGFILFSRISFPHLIPVTRDAARAIPARDLPGSAQYARTQQQQGKSLMGAIY